MNYRRIARNVTIASLLCCASSLAYSAENTEAQPIVQTAQATSNQTAQAQAADAGGVEEIVVTARRRKEELQKIPVTVSVITAATLEQNDVTRIEEIARMSPGFHMEDSGLRVFNKPTTRGTSVSNASNWSIQKTKIFIDGVLFTGNFSAMPFSEVEQVEVLKGPQTTVFGRGALAGAINYITKQPTDEFSGSVSAEQRTNNETHIDAFVSGPIVPGILKAYVNASYYDYGGPNSGISFHNASPDSGEPVGSEKSHDISAKLVFTPIDTTTISLWAFQSLDSDGAPTFHLLTAGSRNTDFSTPLSLQLSGGQHTLANTGPITLADVSQYSAPTNQLLHQGIRHEVSRFTLDANQDFGFATLSSLTGFNHSQEFDDYNATEGYPSVAQKAAPANIAYNYSNPLSDSNQAPVIVEHYRDFQQEFRVTSAGNGPFKYMGGISYYNYREDQQFPGFGTYRTINNTQAEAVFGSIGYEVIEDLTLGAEFRYNRDFIDSTTVGFGSVTKGSGTFSRALPRFTADYQFTPDVLFYSILSEGSSPGSFNTSAALVKAYPDKAIVQEETLWNFEAGIKSQWFDHKVLTNIAIYHERWQNLQLNELFLLANPAYIPGSKDPTQSSYFPITTQQFTSNAGAAHINGIEAEVGGSPIKHLNLHGTMAYDDAIYDQFCSTQAWLLNPTPVPAGQNPATYTGCVSVKGKTTFQQPPWTASMEAVWKAPINDDWGYYGSADWSYVGIKYGSETNIAWTPASEIVNLHAGVESEHMRVDLFIMNATQEDAPVRVRTTSGVTATGGTNQFSQIGGDLVPQKPRQFGIRATYTW